MIIEAPEPRNHELERRVLNALLHQVELPPVCIPLLRDDSFDFYQHKDVFECIKKDYNKHGNVDATRVENLLRGYADEPEQASSIISDIAISEWINATRGEEYVDILNGLAVKRNWLNGMKLEAISIESRTPVELLTNTEKIIHDNIESISIPGLTPSEIEERDSKKEKGEQLFTGDKFMDYTFFRDSGSRRGEIIVPFGESGHGKTFFCVTMADWYLDMGYRGIICIKESTDTKLVKRIKAGLKHPEAADNLIIADTMQGLGDLDDIVNTIKYHHAIKPIDFFIVDHLRIVPVAGLNFWQETERISTSVTRFMELSQEINAFGITPSQVNRETNRNARGWQRVPSLNNLFGSSAIEQAATVAISIFRPREVEELRVQWPNGDLRAVKGPNYQQGRNEETYDVNSVFIRQAKLREGEKYIPYVRFVHKDTGLERVPIEDDIPF